MKTALRLAVLVSGRGSNLQALIDACATPGFPARIELVLSNEPDAFGLTRAQRANIPTKVVCHRDFPDRSSFEGALEHVLEAAAPDLICLAGFMRILSPELVGRWSGRILNIHPSLLPAFKGLNTHARALEAGVKTHGCTVHLVTPELDAGPPVLQAEVPVLADDTPETLAARVLEAEHRIYPDAVRKLAIDLQRAR